MKRHPKILNKKNTALLVIDIQERIIQVIYEYERVIQNTIKLIEGFKVLGLPYFYTEQYPKGLGVTEKRILEKLDPAGSIQKMSFSCCGAQSLNEQLQSLSIKNIVLCGVESHVCVIQTALDLIANDYNVFIAADAVSSRRIFDYQIALNRMEKNGAEITLTESILFEMLELSGTEEFKAISKLVK